MTLLHGRAKQDEALGAIAADGAMDDKRSRLREMSFDDASATLTPVQAKAEGAADLRQDRAADGVSGGGAAMPHLSRLQEAFGRHDLSGVKAHEGGAGGAAAASMGAQAYAFGNDIAFQAAPNLHTAAHEAAHVVQQRSGVALKNNTGEAGDKYEQHADQVADLVVAGHSAEGALDQMAGSGASAAPAIQRLDSTKKLAVSTLNASTVAAINIHIAKAAGWPSVVAMYERLTSGGESALEAAAYDDVLIEVLMLIEAHVAFSGGATLDELWDSPTFTADLVGAVRTAATMSTEPSKPAVPLPKVGTFGMVKSPATAGLAAGGEIQLTAGTAVEVVKTAGGVLTVAVHSGRGGTEATIDPSVFLAQPRLSTDEDTGKPEAYSYQKYEGALFLTRAGVTEPSIADVDQGSLGDCFLIAAMGAVAAANSAAISDAISYDSGSGIYTVTFQELQRNGKFKPVQVQVDAYLPTRSGAGKRTAYAQSDQRFNPANQALWPAIVEKAYAQWKGGYTAIEDGGVSASAMEALTGVRSVRSAMPREKDVVARFQQWESEGKAIICGTRDWIDQDKKEGLFNGSGDGPYRGTLTDRDGAPAELMKGRLSVRDTAGKAGTARDDKKGGFTGANVKSGSVDYHTGRVNLTYAEGKGPAEATTLQANYRYEGTLSSALNLHGNHAYMFRGVEGGKLMFQNPWGPAARKHPKGIDAANFLDLFETLAINAALPKTDD